MKSKTLILINALSVLGVMSVPIMAKKNIVQADTISIGEIMYCYQIDFDGIFEDSAYYTPIESNFGFLLFTDNDENNNILKIDDDFYLYPNNDYIYLSYEFFDGPIAISQWYNCYVISEYDYINSDYADSVSLSSIFNDYEFLETIEIQDPDTIYNTGYETGYEVGYQEALDTFYDIPDYQYNFYRVYDVYNVNYVNDYLLYLSSYGGFPADLTINGVDYDYIYITIETQSLNITGFKIFAGYSDKQGRLELAYYKNSNLSVENVYEGLILVNSIEYYSADEIIDLTGLNPYITAFYGTFLKGVDNSYLENYISQQQLDIEYWMNYASEEANSIYNTGYETGYSNGLETGYSNGYDAGYNDGFIAGTDNPEYNDVWGFLGSLFVGLAPILEIELFGFLPIGYLIAIPIIFAIFAFILGLFR